MTPKELFKRNVKDSSKVISYMKSDEFQMAIAFAQTETMNTQHLNADEINGIKLFLNVLMQLSSEDPTPPRFPDKHLKHDLQPKKKESKK